MIEALSAYKLISGWGNKTMKHHYVPQFLLRAWSENAPDNKIEAFRLDLPSVPSSRLTPEYTAYEPDLYALTREQVAGMDKQAVETKFLKRVDADGAKVRQKLVTQGLNSITPEDRNDWARFVMSLRLRQPHIVTELRLGAAQQLHTSLSDHPEEVKALIESQGAPSMVDWTNQHFPGLIENFGMSFFHELVDNADVGTKIMEMQWWLWRMPLWGPELLIADQPCIFTGGIDAPSLIIALPIVPRIAFMATRGDKVAENLRGHRPRDVGRLLNESSVTQATARLYASNAHQRRFIENRVARIRAAKGQ